MITIKEEQMPEAFLKIIEAEAHQIHIYKQAYQLTFATLTKEEQEQIKNLQNQLMQLFDFLILQKEAPENQKAI